MKKLVLALLLFSSSANADDYACYKMQVDKYKAGIISYESFQSLIASCVAAEKRSWYDRFISKFSS